VFDAIEKRENRIPVVAIARISTPEDLDDRAHGPKSAGVWQDAAALNLTRAVFV
jgi:hypothetical protein